MIDNKRNLRDTGVFLIVFAIIDLFTSATALIGGFFDGTFDKAFSGVEPDIATASKVVLGVIFGFWVLLVVAEILIGVKGIKASANPSAAKGYITAAKVFFVFNVLGVISYIVSMFEMTSATAFSTILAFISALCTAIIYGLFIKYASAVRAEFLKG